MTAPVEEVVQAFHLRQGYGGPPKLERRLVRRAGRTKVLHYLKNNTRHWFFASLTLLVTACGGAKLTELQRVNSGPLDVVLLSSHDGIKHGQDSFIIEFRSADGALVHVGDVRASATMPMPGSPMFGSIEVKRTSVAGRYTADAKFDMAGTWRTTIQWSAPSSPGSSVTFSGNVQ